MPGLVEGFAANVGWTVCRFNVIVEGTSDVAMFWLAATLYHERYRTPILGDNIAVLAAGRGDDGGVDGLNHRMNAARQIADSDRASDGSLQYRFIGLYDNDHAGRRAIDNACNFDRRLRRYRDLFLLHPIMPLSANADYVMLGRRFEAENSKFRGLDWEIEDLLSESMLSAFEDAHPDAVQEVIERSGRKHWEFTPDGKAKLHRFARAKATLEDMVEVVKLIRALRDYLRLKIDHIVC